MKRALIVVADNHANVREVVSGLLDLLEVETVTCAGGDEVLQYLEHHEADCVISDVVMPTMGGMDLVEQLHRRKPTLPVIMMSSYASEALEEEAKSRGAVGLVGKPFKLETVTRLLELAGVNFAKPA